ncbi:hypothetical protein B7486_07020 [cyanobacterium TDX16]|nr:hypothetical protein B7486_07020 [cyanobacterium TDX16]
MCIKPPFAQQYRPTHANLWPGVLLWMPMLLVAGCAPVEQKVGDSASTRIHDPFLRKHVKTTVRKGQLNPQLGLYEIDATIEADSLDADRANSYRVFVRAVYYQGQETQPVDSSQWTELLLQPGDPVAFSSASLTGADRCLLEVAYPEEVGLK